MAILCTPTRGKVITTCSEASSCCREYVGVYLPFVLFASCLISRKVVDSPFTMKVTDVPLVLRERANGELRWPCKLLFLSSTVWFLANVNVLRYVCYMLWAVRLSVCLSVCLLSVVCLSVTLVHPTQAVELFGNFFSPYDSPGTLLFWCQKSLVGDAPFPLKFSFKVTDPL